MGEIEGLNDPPRLLKGGFDKRFKFKKIYSEEENYIDYLGPFSLKGLTIVEGKGIPMTSLWGSVRILKPEAYKILDSTRKIPDKGDIGEFRRLFHLYVSGTKGQKSALTRLERKYASRFYAENLEEGLRRYKAGLPLGNIEEINWVYRVYKVYPELRKDFNLIRKGIIQGYEERKEKREEERKDLEKKLEIADFYMLSEPFSRAAQLMERAILLLGGSITILDASYFKQAYENVKEAIELDLRLKRIGDIILDTSIFEGVLKRKHQKLDTNINHIRRLVKKRIEEKEEVERNLIDLLSMIQKKKNR